MERTVITMFDYKEFKKEMCKRGHEVHKHGDYITIEPNNNYEGYNKGFLYAAIANINIIILITVLIN